MHLLTYLFAYSHFLASSIVNLLSQFLMLP